MGETLQSFPAISGTTHQFMTGASPRSFDQGAWDGFACVKTTHPQTLISPRISVFILQILRNLVIIQIFLNEDVPSKFLNRGITEQPLIKRDSPPSHETVGKKLQF